MDPLVSRLADGYAFGRIALGSVGLLAPRPVGRAFGIGDDPRATVAARHIAARDLVAGVGMVLGRRHGAARGWYEAAGLTDLLDAGIAVVAGTRGALPARRAALVAVLAGGSAAVGLFLARAVDRDHPGADVTGAGTGGGIDAGTSADYSSSASSR